MALDVTDINYLNIFPFVGKVANIELFQLETDGGALPAGSYTFAVRYLDNLGTPTNFFTTSQQIAVPYIDRGNNPIGNDGEKPTTSAIRLLITNIDQEYQQLQLAVIPQYDGVVGTPLLLSPMAITGSHMSLTYTGTEKATESSLDEILINTASYKTGKTITQVDDSLYMGNMTKHDPLNYQRYANNIKLKTVTKEYGGLFSTNGVASFFSSDVGTDPNIATPGRLTYDSKGFKRGGVYAFYISFIMNDGHESPAYHIPGREATSFQYDGQTYSEDATVPESKERLRNIGGVDNQGNPAGRWFQFVSKPHPTLGTGFWENEDEFYPYSVDWEIWDVNSAGEGEFTGQTLSGKNVRHHQMPDADEVPYYRASDRKFLVLGIELENIKIPSEIRDRVRAIRVHYAERGLINQRIVDQSFMLRPDFTDFQGVDTEIPRVTHVNSDVSSEFGTETAKNVLLHPFNTLRLKQNIQGITHLKSVGYNKDTLWDLKPWSSTDDFNVQSSENMVRNLEFGQFDETVDKDFQFSQVIGASYLPSYSFPADPGNNSLVRIKDNVGGVYDFDNTNGEEKVLIRAQYGFFEHWESGEYPNILVELCQYKRNLFLGFDLQDLIYTGFQDEDLDKYDPALDGSPSPSPSVEAFSTGSIFGGDTFLGIFGSRHSRWLASDPGVDVDKPQDQVLQNVRFTLAEMYAWPHYRSPGAEIWEQWYPGTAELETYIAIIWKDGQPVRDGFDGDVFPDNPIRYNRDYLMNETRKPAIPFPKRRSVVTEFPTRAIRSRQDSVEQEADLYRQFLEEDYIDLPANRGELVKLSNLNNLLIPHMERTIMRTRGREEIQTGDFRAFLGSGDIFSVKPEELYETDIGYGGLHGLRSGIVTEYGYFFVDQQARKVFHLTPEGLKNLNDVGMGQFLEDKLAFNFESYGYEPSENVSAFFGIQVGWDPFYNRYLLTKKDVKFAEDFSDGSPSPGPEGLEFDKEAQQFVDPLDSEQYLSWDNAEYFEDDSFTLSFSPETQTWISFHDYQPNMYFYGSNRIFSSKEGVLYLHNVESVMGRFFGVRYPFILEYVDNRDPKASKTIASLFIDSEVVTQGGVIKRDKTMTKVRVKNSYQDTGDIDVSYFKNAGNARYAQGFWRINVLRNIKDENGNLVTNREWYDKDFLSDRYHHVILEFDNSDDNLLFLIASELNVKSSLR